jgi:hypothetical protein
MAELFASGRIVDLIVALMVLEGLALMTWRRWSGRGPRALDLVLNLAAGAALLLALRAALTGSAWPWVALPLTLALPLHLADLCRSRGMHAPVRWPGRGAP